MSNRGKQQELFTPANDKKYFIKQRIERLFEDNVEYWLDGVSPGSSPAQDVSTAGDLYQHLWGIFDDASIALKQVPGADVMELICSSILALAQLRHNDSGPFTGTSRHNNIRSGINAMQKLVEEHPHCFLQSQPEIIARFWSQAKWCATEELFTDFVKELRPLAQESRAKMLAFADDLR